MELTTERVAVSVAVLAVIAIGAIWLVPRLQARRWRRLGLQTKEVAELENSARGTLVQAFAGIALILTFVATWVQIDSARDESKQTHDLTQAQQESERFTRAVEQLGSDKVEVRVGGIYALEQAARESPRRRRPVAQMMIAYLKSNHPLRKNDPRLRAVDRRNRASQTAGVTPTCWTPVTSPWPDTQAAASVLAGLPPKARGRFDLAGVDLIGVRLRGGDFSGVDLRDASLADSDLRGANLNGASLIGTDLRHACMQKANLQNTVIGNVDAVGSDLRGTTNSGIRAYADNGDAFYGAMTDDCESIPKGWKLMRWCKGRP